MGQLIKLQDYASRYEQDMYLYPSRFVRLKKQQWDKLLLAWENGDSFLKDEVPNTSEWDEEEKSPLMSKVKSFLRINKKHIAELDNINTEVTSDSDEHSPMQFPLSFSHLPESKDDLKQHFLEQLFSYQLKWASTTLTETSIIDKAYFFDEKLKYFLQRFPDTVLVLYHPIFLLQKAPVEVEIILITPTDVWCITFLENEESAVFVGSNERFWTKMYLDKEEKVLNPLLGLNRTEKIVKKIFDLYEIDIPTHKLVLSRNGYFDFPSAPNDTRLIEKRNYEEWFQSMRRQKSALKHVQFKAAQALLQYCQTSSFRRVEWDLDIDQNE